MPTSHPERWKATREDAIPIAFAMVGGLHRLRRAIHGRANPLRTQTFPRIAAEIMQRLEEWADA